MKEQREDMKPSEGEELPATKREPSGLKGFLLELRKKRIVEILAGFVGGGWLILEFVRWLLVEAFLGGDWTCFGLSSKSTNSCALALSLSFTACGIPEGFAGAQVHAFCLLAMISSRSVLRSSRFSA